MCNFFAQFIYNEYVRPYFLSHVVLRYSPRTLPPTPQKKVSNNALLGYLVIYSIFNFNKDNITIYYHFPSPKVRLLAK